MERTERTVYTLVFVMKNQELLMGKKTRGLGEGFWNGFGGKVEEGESVWAAANRELKEESNLEADLKHVGVNMYELKKNDFHIVHVYTSTDYRGEIQESEEMNPIEWHPFDRIPFCRMWPDAKIWFPYMLKDHYFSFKEDRSTDKKYQLTLYDTENDFQKYIRTCN